MEATQSDGVDPGDALMSRLMGGPASALKVMAWVRLLTTSDLALAVGIPKRSSRRLLYRLGRQKLVRRNRFSLAGNGGSTWIYTLSAAGARSASELLGYKVPGRRRGAVNTALLNHRLDTTRVLCSAISALSDRLVSIHTGRGLASLFTHTSRIAKYLPDATLAFRVGEGGDASCGARSWRLTEEPRTAACSTTSCTLSMSTMPSSTSIRTSRAIAWWCSSRSPERDDCAQLSRWLGPSAPV